MPAVVQNLDGLRWNSRVSVSALRAPLVGRSHGYRVIVGGSVVVTVAR
jgi:hypothetical protein